MSKKIKIIISGGGTGGHVFPAIAIADALTKRNPDVEILFVGAAGRMEMEKVPAAGYEIIGLPVAGFQRRLTFKNVTFFFKLAYSMLRARRIVRSFKPDVVVGVGGYASGPVLRAASSVGVPTLLQEQNSYPGITNKILARKAHRICVAYPNMERFFPAPGIVLTGNPVRQNLLMPVDKDEAYTHFGLVPDKKTILVLGGSLGAGSINAGIMERIEQIIQREDIQMIWQCGKYYFDDLERKMAELNVPDILLVPFIRKMELAYGVADVVVSRAGAGTISELALLGKASVLVPSPNVSEDHQTKNAMSLVKDDGALLVADHEAGSKLVPEILALIYNNEKRKQLERRIKLFAFPDSADKIAKEIELIVENK